MTEKAKSFTSQVGHRATRYLRFQVSSQQTLVLMYLVISGGKEGHTKIQISAEPRSNLGPFGQKAEILPIAPIMPANGCEI